MKSFDAKLIEEIFSRINRLAVDVYESEGGRFLSLLRASKTLGERYDAILEFDYAANSKELRDTSDENVHSLLNLVRDSVEALNSFLRVDLTPISGDQRDAWVKQISDFPSGKYAFRRNGAIQVGILDSKLIHDALSIRRVWCHVSNYSGCHVNFFLPLSRQQISDFNDRKLLIDGVSCIDDFLY